jgi:molybdopterin converting factor small subunit
MVTSKIRVMLPAHLRNLARVGAEVTLEVAAPATIGATLDALETRYPVLCGTIRDHDTLERRPYIRYFACEEDLSHQPASTPLPDPVLSAREPLIVLGAIAGG